MPLTRPQPDETPLRYPLPQIREQSALSALQIPVMPMMGFIDGINPTLIIQTQRCLDCRVEMNDSNAEQFTWVDEGLVCNECFENYTLECAQCDETHLRHRLLQVRELGTTPRHYALICQSCADQVITVLCNRCHDSFEVNDPTYSDGNGGMCIYCLNAERESSSQRIGLRSYTPSDDLVISKPGTILKSVRPIGVELEVQITNRAKANDAWKNVPKCVGVGTDGSIAGDGIEIRLPPASGQKAEKLVKLVCDQLKAGEFKTDSSCGMHIHFEMADFDSFDASRQVKVMKDLWCNYLAFEEVIMSFLPASRRAKNRYCKAFRFDYSIDEIMACKNLDALERLWYRVSNTREVTASKSESHHRTRYRGVNFHPFLTDRHMEIRFHTGTIKARKILEWANLHARIIDDSFVSPGKYNPETLKEVLTSDDLSWKTKVLIDKLRLSQESALYLIARQASFYEPLQFNNKDESFKSAMTELQEEKES